MREEFSKASNGIVEIVSGKYAHIFNFHSEDVTICEMKDNEINKKVEPEVYSFKNYKKECKTHKSRLNRARELITV